MNIRMNISKYIRFLRRDKQFNWHVGHLWHCDRDQHGTEKIIEYQDRWTLSPIRINLRTTRPIHFMRQAPSA